MLERFVRFALLLPLVLSVPIQGVAAVGGLCGLAGHDAAHGIVIGHGSASAPHPGQNGHDPARPLADAHCAVGTAIPMSPVVLVLVPPAGSVVPAAVVFPPAFVPPDLDRPPPSLLV